MNTFIRKCILLCILSLPILCRGQVNNTDNLGFEKGTFEGWTLSYGNVRLVNNKVDYQNPQNGTTANRHAIVSKAQGNDPKIFNEAIPMVGKQGNYAMRIGKTLNGSTWERATTSFKVTADHSLFQYHFAVLLQEDDGVRHTKPQKPGFSLKITDLGGTLINCGDFDVQLEGSLLAGFKIQGDIEYRNWTTGAIDLKQHIGKTLKVEVTAHGCTGQSHFGYAYFDSELIKSEIKQASACPDLNGNLLLMAPEGFEKYVWSNGTVGRVLSTNAALNEPFKVTITPYSSLDAACNFPLYYTVPFKKADTTINTKLCDGERFVVDNTPFTTTGNFTKIISRGGICDSTINLNLLVNAVPKVSLNLNKCEGESIKIRDTTITTNGIYKVRIKRAGQCDSLVNAEINFEKLEVASSENQVITLGDNIDLLGKTIEGKEGVSLWKNDLEILCSTCNTVDVSPLKDAKFYYETVSQSGICKRSDTTLVKVVPCTVHFPDSFSPDADQFNATFYGFGSKCVAKILTMVIFDRWGDEVFKAENTPVSDEHYGWDGRKNGKELSAGLYTYQAKAQLLDGTLEQFEGSLHLLR